MVMTWFIILIVPILGAQAQNDRQVEEIIATLESNKDSNAVAESLKTLQSFITNGYWSKLQQARKEKIIDVFIKQLRHGQRICQVGESEEAVNYMAHLGSIAGKLKNHRTIPVLVDGLPCSDYEEALAKIGGPAVDSLVKSFTNESTPLFREAILTIFKKMADLNTLTEKDKEKVKRVILKACQAKEGGVRGKAIRVLANYGGEDDISLLTSLLENDAAFYEVNTASGPWTGYGKYKRYIVREEAQKTLEKINKRKIGQSNAQPLQKPTTAQ